MMVYFIPFFVLFVALLVMLWEWRHAIDWQNTPIDKQVPWVKRCWHRLMGYLKTIVHIVAAVSSTPNQRKQAIVWAGVLVSLLFAFVFFPVSTKLSGLSLAWQYMSVVLVVLLILPYVWFSLTDRFKQSSIEANDKSQVLTKQEDSETLISMGLWLLIVLAVLAVAMASGSLDMASMLKQQEDGLNVISLLGLPIFVFASVQMTHRHKESIAWLTSELKPIQAKRQEDYQSQLQLHEQEQEKAIPKEQADKNVDKANQEQTETVSEDSDANTKTVIVAKTDKTASPQTNAEADNQIVKTHQPISYVAEPAFYVPRIQISDVLRALTDYVLLLLLCALAAALYFGGYAPWFGVTSLLPETWFVLKWLMCVFVCLYLRHRFMMFFSGENAFTVEDTHVVATRTQYRWVWWIAMPVAMVYLWFQLVI